jgi:hypothetical protein
MVVIFSIENKRYDYACCLAAMRYLNDGTTFSFDDVFGVDVFLYLNLNKSINGYNSLANQISKGIGSEEKYVRFHNSDALVALRDRAVAAHNSNNLHYCICVENKNEDDCVNLHYFELILKYERNCFIIFSSKQKEGANLSDCYRISKLFSCVNTRDGRHFVAFKGTDNLHAASSFARNDKTGISRTLFPLLEVNEKVYEVLAGSVSGGFEKKSIIDLIVCEAVERIVFECKYTSATWEFCQQLLNDLHHYSCAARDKDVKIMSAVRKKSMHNIEQTLANMRDICGRLCDSSILSLLFFLSFVHSIVLPKGESTAFKDVSYVSAERLWIIFHNAEEYAEGVLQLLENIIAHADGVGFFCYRIHKIGKNEKGGAYLKKNYAQIIFDFETDGNSNETRANRYLEVLISDYNVDYDIPSKFKDNLRGYMKDIKDNNSNLNPKELDKLAESMQVLTLTDFFDYSRHSELWRKFYAYAENITSHYGLQIFEQVVVSANGSFSLESSRTNTVDDASVYLHADGKKANAFGTGGTKPHIPGTQYQIVLPLIEKKQQKPTGLDVNLDFSKIANGEWHTHEAINESLKKSIGNDFAAKPFEKKRRIAECLKRICASADKIEPRNTILQFDVSSFALPSQCEIVSKAITQFIYGKRKNSFDKVALINCNAVMLSTFIRVFGTLYYKKSTCESLDEVEVYLASEDAQIEIVFKGKTIDEGLSVTRALSYYKGEYPIEYLIFESTAKKCEVNDEVKSKACAVEVFPFDLIVKNNGRQLFHRKVERDLGRDLQELPFGCNLKDVHMRVGSKIHLNGSYYEASLLFSISNYISRFAYQLAEKIRNQSKTSEKIILIGYESYSELLVVKTKELLVSVFGMKKDSVDYVIYEETSKHANSNTNPFRRNDSVCLNRKNKFVIIVPIGSTLSTHDKIIADLKTIFGCEVNICLNLVVVLIRNGQDGELVPNAAGLTGIESKYWKKVIIEDETGKIIVDGDVFRDLGEAEVYFLVSVKSKWQDPSICEACFPLTKLYDEKPLLRANKASVVPMINTGLKHQDQEEEKLRVDIVSPNRLHMLEKSLVSGHVKRGDNHYEYYFKTAELMDEILKTSRYKREFDKWCEVLYGEIKGDFVDDICYDFIVAPIHATNAAFVNEIKEHLQFVRVVIWLDAKRDYRDNIKTKYSQFTQLFQNLVNADRTARINFHFIDDSIVSGDHFSRSKTLLQSLFPQEAYSENGYRGVKVNIFESVIVLLNRCSSNSKLKYVSATDKFKNFIELNISALRNHEDACVICKKHSDFNDMCVRSATNELAGKFYALAEESAVLDVEEIKSELDAEEIKSKEAARFGYLKMCYTHEINNTIASNTTCVEFVKERILSVLDKACEGTSEHVRAVMDVIASPFLSFRKSVLSASFEILLRTAYFVFLDRRKDDDARQYKALFEHIETLESKGNEDGLRKFIECILDKLSFLDSNILIRAEFINAFFPYIQKHFSHGDIWVNAYARYVKQLLTRGKQDSQSVWLEELLDGKNREGYAKLNADNNFISDLKDILRLENNLVIADAVNETIGRHSSKISSATAEDNAGESEALELIANEGKRRVIREEAWNTSQFYYCAAYKDKFQRNADEKNKSDTTLGDIAILSVLLIPQGGLSGRKETHRNYYRGLLKVIADILGTKKALLFFEPKDGADQTPIYISSSDANERKADNECLSVIESIQKSIHNGDSALACIGNTYYYKKTDNHIVHVIRIEGHRKEPKGVNWYIVFDPHWGKALKDECRMSDDRGKPTEDMLIRARNLLVLREQLLQCFERDFDNNLFVEYSISKEQVAKLANDKTGSHALWSDLKKEYEFVLKEIPEDIVCSDYANENDGKKRYLHVLAGCLRLMADAVISKLYVCHIDNNIYPKTIMDMVSTCAMDRKSLEFFKKDFCLAAYIVRRKHDSSDVLPNITFDSEIWNAEWDFYQRCNHIRVSFFFALIMNALVHGKCEEHDGKMSVKIDVKLSECQQYLLVENECMPKQVPPTDEGITLKAIASFLEYCKCNELFIKEAGGKYAVGIPLKEKDMQCEDTLSVMPQTAVMERSSG